MRRRPAGPSPALRPIFWIGFIVVGVMKILHVAVYRQGFQRGEFSINYPSDHAFIVNGAVSR